MILAAAASGCVQVMDYAFDYSLGYRLPLGLRIDQVRDRSRLRVDAFRGLDVGTSDLGRALATMGAPTRLRRTPTEEILEYYYVYTRKTRILVRPLFFLPYGGYANFTGRGEDAGLDVVLLAFDHQGVLRRKELRLATPDESLGGVAKGAVLQ